MAEGALLKTTVLRLDGRKYSREIKEHCTLKQLFPAIKHSPLQRKNIFLKKNYSRSQPFLMRCYFTKIFVHLSVTAAACC